MSVCEAWDAERAGQVISRHRGQDGPLLPILHALQDTFGYVPDAAVPIVAEPLPFFPATNVEAAE